MSNKALNVLAPLLGLGFAMFFGLSAGLLGELYLSKNGYMMLKNGEIVFTSPPICRDSACSIYTPPADWGTDADDNAAPPPSHKVCDLRPYTRKPNDPDDPLCI